MSQQINLYQPMFRTTRKIFSALTIVQVAAVFVGGLLLIYGFAAWQVARLDEQIAVLERQRTVAMGQLQVLAARAPAAGSRLVEDQLQEATTEAEQKQRLLHAFETRRLGNTRGFSAHFAGLARQRVKGLWLTLVEIRDGGVGFAGATEAGELLPRYIAKLGQEPAFVGTDFKQLYMSRSDDDENLVRFAVNTAAAAEAE